MTDVRMVTDSFAGLVLRPSCCFILPNHDGDRGRLRAGVEADATSRAAGVEEEFDGVVPESVQLGSELKRPGRTGDDAELATLAALGVDNHESFSLRHGVLPIVSSDGDLLRQGRDGRFDAMGQPPCGRVDLMDIGVAEVQMPPSNVPRNTS